MKDRESKNKMLARMQVSIEILYHYCCGVCSKWWSIADIAIQIGVEVTCPHCGAQNFVESMTNGKQQKVQGIGWLHLAQRRDAITLDVD